MQSKPLQKTVGLVGALLAWTAVGVQLYLLLQNPTAPLGETLVRFVSFFTILTNTLVAVCLTAVAAKGTNNRNFFAAPSTLSAVTVYILVVGIVYNLVLRFTWNPQGMQKMVDELLHTVNPVYYLLFWIFLVPKEGLQWKSVFPWLLYPFAYLVYVLLRGAASGFYPYPFINVTDLGYAKIAVNCVGLLFVFLLLSYGAVGAGKLLSKGKDGA